MKSTTLVHFSLTLMKANHPPTKKKPDQQQKQRYLSPFIGYEAISWISVVETISPSHQYPLGFANNYQLCQRAMAYPTTSWVSCAVFMYVSVIGLLPVFSLRFDLVLARRRIKNCVTHCSSVLNRFVYLKWCLTYLGDIFVVALYVCWFCWL